MRTVSTPPALRIFYRELVFYRRIWRENFIGAFVQPLLYLLGVGIGVGSLVDAGNRSDELLGDVSYFAFYATALMATTAMFNAGQEALWSTMEGFEWSNAYKAMMATPLQPADLATGFLFRFGGRVLVTAVGVASVLALFDETRSLGLLAAIVVAVLCGLAFAMPLAAWTASRDSDRSFPAILRFVITPMFLFGGAFYPIDQLPQGLQVVAWVTPLWHAIELSRGSVLGGLAPASAIGHLAVLLAYVGAGWLLCVKTFTRRLNP